MRRVGIIVFVVDVVARRRFSKDLVIIIMRSSSRRSISDSIRQKTTGGIIAMRGIW